ncbi:N-acylethanolamine-hydrolyzing acid amidase-like [Trichosurus vulpecula]|uniref:N-acylethanolamine-hydrolyzing acid amidase-like n=1 Tax=Trichosurus vulpecula TaxID=9337 RepID=UPI00186AFB64|nr:N-acylethanolamine-hydrolyzing acid amidase-like [Trichosurus vulpecula]
MRPWDAVAGWGRPLGLLLVPLLLWAGTAAGSEATPAQSRDVVPQLVNVNLDDDPEQRWMPVLQRFDLVTLREDVKNAVKEQIPRWVYVVIKEIINDLDGLLLEPYTHEIRGICNALNISFVDGILFNLVYESSVFCTSIVAQDTNGRIYHARNLDYEPGEGLRNFTVDVQFIKNGQIAYTGTTFVGYVGIWTGQSPHKFTISGNQRDKGLWWENAVAALVKRHLPISWVFRNTLEEAQNFDDAVRRLSETPLITNVYCIIGGVSDREGLVISRNRDGPVDMWLLNPEREWFLVQTNCDHWMPCPPRDYRRIPAMKTVNETGQANINLDKLYEILSICPILNHKTVYTTVMSAAEPDKYTTRIRNPNENCE